MADAADFIIRLQDLVSGPARAVNQALGSVNATGTAVASALPAVLKGAAGAVAGVGKTIGKALSGDIKGALSDIGGAAQAGIGKVEAMLAGLGPYGQAAAAALSVATAGVGALASALVDGMGKAIGMAEGAAKMKATWAAIAGGKGAGDAALASLSKLATQLPFSAGQVREWGQALTVAGFKGKALEEAVKAVASAQAIMGESGAAAAQKMLSTLAMGGNAAKTVLKDIQGGGRRSAQALLEMGLSVKDVATAAGMTVAQFQKANLSAADMGKALEKALQKKGKGPLDEMMGSWPVILAKAKAGLSGLFGGLGAAVKPFMAAVKELFGQFNKGQAPMKSLGKVVAEVFGTLFKYATMGVKAISAFVKENFTAKNVGNLWAGMKSVFSAVGSVIGGIVGVVKKVIAAIGGGKGKFDWMLAGKVLAGILVAGFAIVAIAIGSVIAAAAFAAAPFIIAAAAGVALIAVVRRIPGAASSAFAAAKAAVSSFVTGAIARVAGFVAMVQGKFRAVVAAIKGAFAGLSLSQIASNIIKSLLDGVGSMVGAVVAKFTAVGNAAKNALKSALGIASPSKVGTEVGKNVGASTAAGAESSIPKVKAAASKVGKAATPTPGAATPGKPGASAGGNTYTITYTGSREDFPDFEGKMLDLFERAKISASPAPPGGP